MKCEKCFCELPKGVVWYHCLTDNSIRCIECVDDSIPSHKIEVYGITDRKPEKTFSWESMKQSFRR